MRPKKAVVTKSGGENATLGHSYSFPTQDEWRKLYAHGVEEIVKHVFVAFIERQGEPKLSWEHDKRQ